MKGLTSGQKERMEEIDVTPSPSSFSSYLKRGSNGSSQAEEVMHIVAAAVYTLIFLLGTTGNGLVIWITGFKMSRTVNTIWFLNLAIADFIFAALRPFAVVREAMRSHWPFGSTLCKVNGFVKYLNMYASVFILTTISIDRYVLVVHPVWSRNNRSTRKASIITVVVWIIATFFSVPYIFLRDAVMDSRDHNKTRCDFSFLEGSDDKRRINLALYVTRFTFGFLVPFLVITTCYVIICLKIKDRNWSNSNRPFIIIVATIVTFFVCWMPYHVFNFLKTTNLPKQFLKVGYRISTSIAYLNSCLNPLMYLFVGYSFRKRAGVSLLSALKSVFADDPNQAKVNLSSESVRLTLRKMTDTFTSKE
ncbi:chemokine-like receptor 1 [Polyodon spathula]|uniref:chemokine-like receptor 1 n=1 Tax=Polyodon spathula TaxID=7913 RepID=UPI001B7F4794|nr:chemokine-like receptor 1 [Polyodon spathula]